MRPAVIRPEPPQQHVLFRPSNNVAAKSEDQLKVYKRLRGGFMPPVAQKTNLHPMSLPRIIITKFKSGRR